MAASAKLPTPPFYKQILSVLIVVKNSDKFFQRERMFRALFTHHDARHTERKSGCGFNLGQFLTFQLVENISSRNACDTESVFSHFDEHFNAAHFEFRRNFYINRIEKIIYFFGSRRVVVEHKNGIIRQIFEIDRFIEQIRIFIARNENILHFARLTGEKNIFIEYGQIY